MLESAWNFQTYPDRPTCDSNSQLPLPVLRPWTDGPRERTWTYAQSQQAPPPPRATSGGARREERGPPSSRSADQRRPRSLAGPPLQPAGRRCYGHRTRRLPSRLERCSLEAFLLILRASARDTSSRAQRCRSRPRRTDAPPLLHPRRPEWRTMDMISLPHKQQAVLGLINSIVGSGTTPPAWVPHTLNNTHNG